MIVRSVVVLFAAWSIAGAFPSDLLAKPDAWFGTDAGRTAVANVLSWQAESGSWPKNQDNSAVKYSGKRKETGTFDNGSTTDELRFLARAFQATGDLDCRDAFLLGFDHVLAAQYPNGGWPQYFPLSSQYHRHITFNDHTMIRLMEFLRGCGTSKVFDFIGRERREAAGRAFERGLDCILKCQVVVHGTPTVWCAQHDEVTLKPAAARNYELPALSGSESAGILRFLMSIENPRPEVVRAVRNGVAWFGKSKVEGIRIDKQDGVRTAVGDPEAPPIWARFYDLETNRPFFCDRDGVKKWSYNKIGRERRNGYAWFGNWGEAVAKSHSKWAAKQAASLRITPLPVP
jgi:PelA/Pel-15E family pectate lyase